MDALDFGGSPRRAGQAHGEQLRERIHALANLRIELTLGRTDFANLDELLAMGRRHVEVLRRASEPLAEEFLGIAEGAGIDHGALVVLNHYTDLRDLSRKTLYDDQGCSAVFMPADPPVLGQTWDMHGSAAPFVEAMRFDVDGAPRCITFSLTGCLGMAGINEHGVAVTINNLNTPTTRIGVLWPALVRMMLSCRTAAEAAALLSRVGVGSGHHYKICDEREFLGIEALATGQRTIAHWRAGEGGELTYPRAACHTNHCLDDHNASQEIIAPISTTHLRWNALDDLLTADDLEASPEGLWNLLGDPRLSMLISEDEPHQSATCGGLVFDRRGETPAMRVCRGPMTGQVGDLLPV